VLLVEPQYAEYRHVLETVIGCHIDRFMLDPGHEAGPDLDPRPLEDQVGRGYDLVVMVNPNNPLGYRFAASRLADLLSRVPPPTTCWVDETYVDFAGADASIERFAATSSNVIVGKSMSKSYALSGLRVGYLCGPPRLLGDLWRRTPPWSISRPAQVAAIAALAERDYYRARYRETAELRAQLHAGLSRLPALVSRPGIANFVFCDLREGSTDAATLKERAAERGLRIRDFPMDPAMRWRAIRVAVGDRLTNERTVQILAAALEATEHPKPSPVRRRGD
jgi:histidinol-phosphate/aromatic aminotransferase/cobyric acid decarboxylase-like protein